MRDGVDPLDGFFEAFSGGDVLDLDELEPVGVRRVPPTDMVCLGRVANGAADVPTGSEEGVDNLRGDLSYSQWGGVVRPGRVQETDIRGEKPGCA